VDEVRRERMKKEREMVKQGKKPYYPKQCRIFQQCVLPFVSALIEVCSRDQEDGTGEAIFQDVRQAGRTCYCTETKTKGSEGTEEYAMGTSSNFLIVCLSAGFVFDIRYYELPRFNGYFYIGNPKSS
jgi:hypothetical protein